MHILRFIPDIDHPLTFKIDKIKKIWIKHQNMWPVLTKKRALKKEELLDSYEKLKLDALRDFRVMFPEFKDAEIKITNLHAMLPSQNSAAYRYGFEIRLPYKEE